MLTCSACVHTCIRSILSDVLSIPAPLQFGRSANRRASQHRQISTSNFHSNAVPRAEARSIVRHVRNSLVSDKATPRHVAVNPRQKPTEVKEVKKNHIRRELTYLSDPLKLADLAWKILQQDNQAKALDMVRMASRNMACTVSWNHIIDYEMSKGHVNNAVKIYNEMKKRAQIPDSYTYMLLLRGFANHTDYRNTLERALSIYHSMFAESSPCKPTIMHTNAVLKVCARKPDLDALFGIAAKLPLTGPQAPNAWTFTTILNAIRRAAWIGGEKLPYQTTEQMIARKRQAIMQGRRMWGDIIGRWGKGNLVIDEELVCAIGRLLLLGSEPQDPDDVLSLVEQTMGIPRGIPRIGDPRRKTHHTKPRTLPVNVAKEETEGVEGTDGVDDTEGMDDIERAEETEELKDVEGMETEYEPDTTETPTEPEPPPLNNEPIFYLSRPIYSRTTDPPNPPSTTYSLDSPLTLRNKPLQPLDPSFEFQPLRRLPLTPRPVPGPNTLSLLITACTSLHATEAAHTYWCTLTSPPYSISPDADNIHTYLRHLRASRSSRLALDLLKAMPQPPLNLAPLPKSFRLVMSACARDARNQNAPAHAVEVVRFMLGSLEEPDLKTLDLFVEVLRKAEGRWLREGLDVLEGVWANLRSLVAYGSWRRGEDEEDEDEEEGVVDEDEDEDREEVGTKAGKGWQRGDGGREVKLGMLDRQTLHEIVGLGQRVNGLWHRLIDTAGGKHGRKEVREWQAKRWQLSVWLGRVESVLRGKAGVRREGEEGRRGGGGRVGSGFRVG